MKAPSRNIAASLRGQMQGAGKSDDPQVSQLRAGGPTMTVPGEGRVEYPAGYDRQNGEGRAARLASKYCMPMARYGG